MQHSDFLYLGIIDSYINFSFKNHFQLIKCHINKDIIPSITKIIQVIYAILMRTSHFAFFWGVSKNLPNIGSSSSEIMLSFFRLH